MNKIFFLCVIFLIAGKVVFAQALYNVRLLMHIDGGPNSLDCEYNANMRFRTDKFVLDLGNPSPNWSSDFIKTGTISIDENSLAFYTSGRNREKSPGGGCYGDQDLFNSKTDCFNVYKSTSYWTKKYGVPAWYGNSFGSITFYPANLDIKTVVGPDPTDGSTLAQYSQTNINATSGFPVDAYTWRYRIVDENNQTGLWVDLPARFQYKSTISINGNDLFDPTSFEAELIKGSKINVAVFAKNANGVLVRNGTPRTLTLKFNSPKIVSLSVQKAKCSTSQTTSILVKFDKAIGTNKRLEVSSTMVGVQGGEAFFITDDSLNNNLEYEFKGNVLNKTYTFYINDYQEFKTGTWSTLNPTFFTTRDPFNYKTDAIDVLPPILQTQTTLQRVYCNGGQDGTISAEVKGGTPPYSLTYKNKTSNSIVLTRALINTDVKKWVKDIAPVDNLEAADYAFMVSDKNGCLLEEAISITQPPTPLSITTRTITEVSGYGLSNGAFEVKLTGGTTLAPQAYPLPTMLHSNGTVYTALFNGSQNNEFAFLFNNLPAGTYALRGEDAALTPNKAQIRDSAGCMVKETTIMVQPPPLLVSLEQIQSVTCNGGQNGILEAHAKGGKRFASGLPYTYAWSYSSDGVVAYTALSNTDSILTNRKAGFYSLIVKDKNNNTTPTIYEITQPAKVDFDVTIKNVTCLNWTDGALTLSNLRGGSAPYTVNWYDGSSAYQVSNLGHGFYTVTVSDALACSTVTSIQVKDTLNEITLFVVRTPCLIALVM